MYPDININWDVFNFKFSSNKQAAFEQLSYLIFCFEHEVKHGIFRYFNQTGIETNPIKVEDQIIGFQAKYFDEATMLSSKVSELKDSIADAKRKNPEINKLLFYINKEFGESTIADQQSPKYKIDIETYGKALGVVIEWRVKSHFEMLLSNPDIIHLRDFFFNPMPGIKGFITQMESHSHIILSKLKSELSYDNNSIKINSDEILKTFQMHLVNADIVTVFGKGGSGKSALIKDWNAQIASDFPCLVFRATDFNVSNLGALMSNFGSYTLSDIISLYAAEEKKFIVIDSAEKIFMLDNTDSIHEALHLLISNQWKVIFSIRTSYQQNLENFLDDMFKQARRKEIEINYISIKELQELAEKNQFPLPESENLKELLCNLFYLNLYLGLNPEEASILESISAFKTLLWDKCIKNSQQSKNAIHIRRERCILSLVKECMDIGSFYAVMDKGDHEAVSALEADGIIVYEETFGGYYLTHDVYEELVLQRMINLAFARKTSVPDFFEQIGSSMLMRKAFRIWVSDSINNLVNVNDFLKDILVGRDLVNIWRDEILISLMSDEKEQELLNALPIVLSLNNFSILFRALALINTACKEVDKDNALYQAIIQTDRHDALYKFLFLKPVGYGWYYLIKYTYEVLDKLDLNPQNTRLLISILRTWVGSNRQGETTRYAGLIALHIYDICISRGYSSRLHKDDFKSLMGILLESSRETKQEFETIFTSVINNREIDHRTKYYELCDFILTDIVKSYEFICVFPEIIIDLVNLFWKNTNDVKDRFETHDGVSYAFGISKHFEHKYYPSSALQTPIFIMLKLHPHQTINFIVEFSNYTAEHYLKSKFKHECQIINIELDGKVVRQVISDRLWKLHRGTGTAPHLLESIYMALEKWLLNYIEITDEVDAVNICKRLLYSKSCAITSVIVSAVLAYPEKLFEIALIFLPVREIFIYDTYRYTTESHANFLRGANPRYALYDNERIESNELSFRKQRLEDIILNYQIITNDSLAEISKLRAKRIQNILDAQYEICSCEENRGINNINWQFSINRMDIRNMKAEETVLDGKQCIILTTELPQPLQEISAQTKAESDELYKYSLLNLWSRHRLENDSNKYCQYQQYESNHSAAFVEMQALVNELSDKKDEFSFMNQYTPIYVSSVLLRDFGSALSQIELDYCKSITLEYLKSIVYGDCAYQAGDGSDAAILVLPLLINTIAYDQILSQEHPAIILLFLLLQYEDNIKSYAIKCFSRKMWKDNPETAGKVFSCYVNLKNYYDDQVAFRNWSSEGSISPAEFLQKYQSTIMEIWNRNTLPGIDDIDHLDTAGQITAFCLLDPIHKATNRIAINLIEKISEKIFDDDLCHKERLDYLNFFDVLAIFIIHQDDEISAFVNAFVPHLLVGRNLEFMLQKLIFAEDALNKPEVFWALWLELYNPIVELCKKYKERYLEEDSYRWTNTNHFLDNIVTTYALSFTYWNEKVKEWHSFGRENTTFIVNLCTDLGYMPSMLYSISRLLDGIGSAFESEGINWLCIILNHNPHLIYKQLPVNTIYYLELFVRRYLFRYKSDVKRNPELKKRLFEILDFLVENGSTCGFMLRESIV